VTTALVVAGTAPGIVELAADLAAVGIHVLGATTRDALVHDAAQHLPDVVVCHEVSPDEALFEAFARLAGTTPRPAIVFTHDPEAARIERAMAAGIHAYVVNGYGVQRLRAVIHVAMARFESDTRLREALADVTRRFDERKLVDRAKGILMRARQVSEEEAFAVLRAASMHSNQRVGQVSRQVIAAAHYADAVNRAGKLRMLSQRLVKLYALRLLEPGSAGNGMAFDESAAQIDTNIGALGKSLSKPTFGDLLEAVRAAWAQVQALVAPSPSAARLAELDGLAERLLLQADQLTRQLETAGLVTTLHVINVSGRQRMLSQRHAKDALLGLLLPDDAAGAARAEMVRTAVTFDLAMAHLKAAPLSTPEIRALLEEAERLWAEAGKASAQVRRGHGTRAFDEASEALLGVFEQLTDRYERSMQVLMG
jgi:AmiR/NasT family two-component response regulator